VRSRPDKAACLLAIPTNQSLRLIHAENSPHAACHVESFINRPSIQAAISQGSVHACLPDGHSRQEPKGSTVFGKSQGSDSTGTEKVPFNCLTRLPAGRLTHCPCVGPCRSFFPTSPPALAEGSVPPALTYYMSTLRFKLVAKLSNSFSASDTTSGCLLSLPLSLTAVWMPLPSPPRTTRHSHHFVRRRRVRVCSGGALSGR
jgi:hypothetical protein